MFKRKQFIHFFLYFRAVIAKYLFCIPDTVWQWDCELLSQIASELMSL